MYHIILRNNFEHISEQDEESEVEIVLTCKDEVHRFFIKNYDRLAIISLMRGRGWPNKY